MKRSEDIKKWNLSHVRAYVWACLDVGFDALFSPAVVKACGEWKAASSYYRDASYISPSLKLSAEEIAAKKVIAKAKYATYKAARDRYDALLMA